MVFSKHFSPSSEHISVSLVFCLTFYPISHIFIINDTSQIVLYSQNKFFKEFTPKFYATFQLLNVKNHELYSDKFVLSVVNLNQIDKATEEARRLRRGLELALEQAQAEIRDKNNELQAQANEIARLKALLAKQNKLE